MKLLAGLLDRMRPLFGKGGTLHTLHPIYAAADNFFFASTARAMNRPYGRDPIDLKRYMTMVILGLLPCFAAALYFFGLRVLAMIFVSYLAGGLVEVLFAVVRKEDINEGFLVTGFIFPLVLPPAVPLWMVGLGCAFGVLVGKELFGGTGRNPFNPALVGRCFLGISYPAQLAAGWVTPGAGWTGRALQYVAPGTVDAITTATPLGQAKSGVFIGLADLFLGRISGCAGETSALAVLLGGGFLLLTRVSNWRTVFSVLGSFFALNAVLRLAFPAAFGPPVWHLLAGGVLFGAFFMATDPVTSPLTNGGKWLYGLLIGATTVLIRNLTGYVEGVTFAILLGNIFAPTLDEIVCRAKVRKVRNEDV